MSPTLYRQPCEVRFDCVLSETVWMMYELRAVNGPAAGSMDLSDTACPGGGGRNASHVISDNLLTR